MLKIDSTHDMSDYMELLSSSLTIYMDDERLNAAYDKVLHATDDLKWLTLLWLRIESAGMYTSVNPDNIVDFLWRIGVDLEKRYANRKTKSLSLDMKKVINPLIEAGVAVELLTHYKEYRTTKSYASSLSKLMERKTFHQVTADGRTIVKFPTHIDERDNLRVYYSDIAVVSVPKAYSDMITGPSDNYYLAWCDYPQADWRFAYNLFIRGKDNEQVMRECDDAYEGLARLVEGENFDPEKFKTTRKEFKVHCLKVFYNSKDNAPIPSAIREYFRSRPKYRKLLYDLNVLYQFKLPIPCTSYFGYEQLIPEGTYPDAFVSKALNTPIQTFTSHIVNETVFGVLKRFWDLGYTKEDINVYYVRHDEPLFLFTKKILKDAWIFKECSEIYIPGFTPIKLDFHFGKYYQQEDEQLTAEVNENIERNAGLVTVYRDEDHSEEVAREYSPMPSVESVYAQFFDADGKGTRVSLYNYRTGQRSEFFSGEGNSESALNDVMSREAIQWLGVPQYLLVRTSGLDFMNYAGPGEETLMKVIDRYDSNVALSA